MLGHKNTIMKTPLNEIDGCPNPSPWGGLTALVLLGLAMVIVMLVSSCAQIEAIPFSVSYQTRDGATVTISKPRIIREK